MECLVKKPGGDCVQGGHRLKVIDRKAAASNVGGECRRWGWRPSGGRGKTLGTWGPRGNGTCLTLGHMSALVYGRLFLTTTLPTHKYISARS